MEIKVGIQHVNREIVVDSADSAADVEKAISDRARQRHRARAHRPAGSEGADPRRGDRLHRHRRGERPARRLRLGLSRRRARGRLRPAARAGPSSGVWLATSRENIRLIAARSMPGRSTVPVSRLVKRVAVGRHPLGLAQRLADQPSTPQRQPAGELRVGGGAARAPGPRCSPQPLVGQHLVHEGAGVGVDEGGHLAVEVGGEAVPDVDLDQALVPVPRLGEVVEGVERGVERAASPPSRRPRDRPAGPGPPRSGRPGAPPARRPAPCRPGSGPPGRPRPGARTRSAPRTPGCRAGRPLRPGSRRRRSRSAAPGVGRVPPRLLAHGPQPSHRADRPQAR